MVVNVLRKAVAAQTSSRGAGDGLRRCADRSRPLRARCVLAGAIASVASDGIGGALRRGSDVPGVRSAIPEKEDKRIGENM
jgi:hypothetical protein